MQNLNEKFKIDINKRCYAFGLSVIKFTDTLPNKRVYLIITDQLIMAATSIGVNLIEAKASSSRLEYKKFYEIALKSANETIYWLNLLSDLSGSSVELVRLISEAGEIAKMLGKGVISLKTK